MNDNNSNRVHHSYRNRFDALCNDIRYYIAEYVSSVPEREIQYIREYKEVLLDWYNKYTYRGTKSYVYRNYSELYTQGIPSEFTPYMKYGFFSHRKESKYYNFHLSPHNGRLVKTAKRAGL
jgi:hypothetical protein